MQFMLPARLGAALGVILIAASADVRLGSESNQQSAAAAPSGQEVVIPGASLAGGVVRLPDGRLLWTTREKKIVRVFVDGTQVGADAEAISPLVYSDDWNHVAFAVRRGSSATILIDGVERDVVTDERSKAYFQTFPLKLVLASDGRTAAHWTVVPERTLTRSAIRLLGEPARPEVEDLQFAAVAAGAAPRLAYAARRNGEALMFLDGKEIPGPSKDILKTFRATTFPFKNLVFGPGGRRVAYLTRVFETTAVKDGDKSLVGALLPWVAALDGVVQKVPTIGVGPDIFSPFVFSPDGSRVAYASVAADGSGWLGGAKARMMGRVVIDGTPGPVYNYGNPAVTPGPIEAGDVPLVSTLLRPWWGGVSIPAFSPDSRHAAYVGRAGDRQFVLVVDGAETPLPPVERVIGGPVYSPDGSRIACVGANKGEVVVFIGGKQATTTPVEAADIASDLTFSADGSRFAFAVGRADGGTIKYRIVVDGKAHAEFPAARTRTACRRGATAHSRSPRRIRPSVSARMGVTSPMSSKTASSSSSWTGRWGSRTLLVPLHAVVLVGRRRDVRGHRPAEHVSGAPAARLTRPGAATQLPTVTDMQDRHSSLLALIIAATGFLLPAVETAAQDAPLVEFGKTGGGSAGFALGPVGWRDFARDAVFIVGQSAAPTDWPYVHPGPDDAWAGRRVHTYRIVVDLASVPPGVDGELAIDMLDTHRGQPPEVEFGVNGADVGREALPEGGGDGSLNGRLDLARRHAVRVRVPAGTLRTGRNILTITNRKGSWFLYERVSLRLAGAALAPVSDATFVVEARPVTAILERDGRLWQPVTLDVVRAGGARPMAVRADGTEVLRRDLQPGRQDVEILIPAVEATRQVALDVDGQTLATAVRAVPKLTVYIVPHSHTDIGYTNLQPEVEQRQVENLVKGMAIAEQTASYPEGARFVWNVEVLWAADLFLQRMEAPRRAAFDKAVKSGQVGLNGLYLNVLSGLSRPEELVQAARFATQLSARLGVTIDAAMISDIPGHTWGLVPALAQAGIRYLSTSPNFFDRIGTTQVASADQPFWWVGPSGPRRSWPGTRGWATRSRTHGARS